jgi:predicted RNase H-like HicB family nuclease
MKKERIFDVIIHEAEEGGYWAECPALRGCYAQGESLDEVKENIKEAIELVLEEIKNKRLTIPSKKRIYLTPIAV